MTCAGAGGGGGGGGASWGSYFYEPGIESAGLGPFELLGGGLLPASTRAAERMLGTTGIKIVSHGVERMLERGITEKYIETALRKGTRYYDPEYGTIAHVLRGGFASGKSLTVWYDAIDDAITSVLRSARNPVLRRYIPLP